MRHRRLVCVAAGALAASLIAGLAPAPTTAAATCDLAGTWTQTTDQVGSTDWTITANGKATEGNASSPTATGDATLSGNDLTITWKSATGSNYAGTYNWKLDAQCHGMGTLHFTQKDPGDTRQDLASTVVGPAPTEPPRGCGSERAGLRATPRHRRPTERFGPISVYGHVPGLAVIHRRGKWVIKGLKLAHLHDRWTLDDCGGIGEIRKVRTKNVIAGGRPVATVGDEVFAPATSHGCPSDPLAVSGEIVTGDPRVAIHGRAVAVPGSRVETFPVCGSNVGHVT